MYDMRQGREGKRAVEVPRRCGGVSKKGTPAAGWSFAPALPALPHPCAPVFSAVSIQPDLIWWSCSKILPVER